MGIVPDEDDIARMPISKTDLRALFEHLDRAAMTGHECDHSFSRTEDFLRERGLAHDTVMPWLGEHGAGCDCEVMFNVAENWGEVVGYVSPDDDDADGDSGADAKPWWKFW